MYKTEHLILQISYRGHQHLIYLKTPPAKPIALVIDTVILRKKPNMAVVGSSNHVYS